MLTLCCVLAGCDKVFDYHPYDVRFGGETDINSHNIERIEEACRDKETLKVVFMGDTHGWYTETKAMVNDINRRGDVDFVLHGGDLTDCGTTDEYEWARDILSKLNMPYVALIGNHDMLGTGDEVYKAMFGQTDFSFIAAGIKFVCLNTNATEYDYIAAVPDFDYMERQVTENVDRFDRTIVCMHARPYCEQFNNNVAKVFEYYVTNFPGLLFCTNAHDHHLQVDDLFGDGVIYYGTDCSANRNYLLFTITKEGYEYEVVYF